MPTYLYQCTQCEQVDEHFFKYADKPESTECTACKGPTKTKITMPNTMGVRKKDGVATGAMPDGVTGFKGRGWDKIKKANKYQQLAYNQPVDSPERKEIEREVKELKKI